MSAPFNGGDGGPHSSDSSQEKPCKACTDFKTWAKQHGLPLEKMAPLEIEKHRKRECPPDKSELGRNTWTFLHTMAAYYPDEPTITEQKNMSEFMRLFSEFYPCSYCAKDLRMEMAKTPPVTVTRTEFSYWLCDMHNRVNVKLGKPVFDCKLVDERWKDGWRDGSCNWGS